ncbi:Uncharacterised protein [Staphylococcus petrasii]|nr:Uncharacterised protein [Staphylococcus petrasii]
MTLKCSKKLSLLIDTMSLFVTSATVALVLLAAKANLLKVLSFFGVKLVDVLVESLTNKLEPISRFAWLSAVLVDLVVNESLSSTFSDLFVLVELVNSFFFSEVDVDELFFSSDSGVSVDLCSNIP